MAELDALGGQMRLLIEHLELMDEHDFVEGRAACIIDEAQLARCTGLGDSLEGVLKDLTGTGLASRKAAEVFEGGRPEAHMTARPAAEVFVGRRLGLVFRLRRPDVVLAVESTGPLRVADSWVRRPHRGQI